MRIKVEAGKKLRVIGPASIMLVEGNVNVLGSSMRRRERLIIPLSKAAVVEVLEDSILEINVGEGGSVDELKEDPVPYDWTEAVRKILERSKPISVLILGDVDSGKSTFSNFLVNQSLIKGFKTALIDVDLGQSEIGAPTTISLALLRRPVPSLSKVKMNDGYFVGSTNPQGKAHRILVGVKYLYEKSREKGADVIVINTDGWIDEIEARELKIGIANIVRPDFVVAIEKKNELEPILRPLESQRWLEIIRLATPLGVRRRTPEERKLIRQNMYRKYLQGARIRAYPLNRVRFMYSIFGNANPLPEDKFNSLIDVLGGKRNILWAGETVSEALIILRKGVKVDNNAIEKIKEILGKEVKIIKQGYEKGILVGLADENGSLKGIGVIDEIDFSKNVIRILTPVEEKVSVILIGNIRLDEKLNEIAKLQEPVL